MTERDSAPVRIPNTVRERIAHLKIRLSSEVMQDISLGSTITLLTTLGEQEYGKLAVLARKEQQKK
jgi:hypothetical protein